VLTLDKTNIQSGWPLEAGGRVPRHEAGYRNPRPEAGIRPGRPEAGVVKAG
jgi:hypothetical protein